MTINIFFKILPHIGTTLNSISHIRCNECKKLTLITFSKPLICSQCGSVLSEYSAHITRTVNSRIIYYNSQRKKLWQ